MSLLMKALEKAAKDRGEAQQTPAPATAAPAAPPPAAKPPAMELTLEPMQVTAPASSEPAPPLTAGTPRASHSQARAATVLQATASSASPTGSRIRPAMAFGIIGAVCVIAIGIYVYLLITNPGLFITKPPTPQTPLGQAPQPPAAPAAPVAIGSVVAPAGAGTDVPAASAAPAAPRAAAIAPAAPAAAQASAAIRVSAGSAGPELDPRLSQGYAALQSGQLDAARQFYGDAARSEPHSVQALLGLAAIAMQENRTEEASRLYFNVLDLEPRNAYAQSGLIALLGRADPVSAETKLKQLISRDPMPSLYFTLGNLYGDQSRWPEAQQAYFQAHHRDPANPDYAYNLAVGLEHVGQPRLAVNFYQRAITQSAATGRAGFNPAQAQERIRQLASQPK